MKQLGLKATQSKVTLWQQVRIPFLIVAFSSLMLALGKSIVNPPASAPPAFTFPSVIPLPGWQPLPSSPLPTNPQSQQQPVEGRHYRYIQNSSSLEIEMRYLVNTDGDVKTLIQNYTSIPLTSLNLSSELRQQQGVGSYLLLTDQQRAYLSACINPHGESTVTREQFVQNRNTNDLQPTRLLSWLLGRADLRDWRCLWAHLSIPLSKALPESYRALEAAWVSWDQKWTRFPN